MPTIGKVMAPRSLDAMGDFFTALPLFFDAARFGAARLRPVLAEVVRFAVRRVGLAAMEKE
jgi:hypothetical protein